ncbi:hypothetical protein P3T36_007179 [Kitasatospora sp. MAP12-15]|uniref:hypothetical protein n=1 Tax=unclassified Kitasatospora TaxID=2633591 RepID=UPI0024760025|nr:hypothetical protein [Kitasatospora sp. MAP12-44]MDH6115343.1 hypothetical protein [Kitasatospora sp. MAP12-44]
MQEHAERKEAPGQSAKASTTRRTATSSAPGRAAHRLSPGDMLALQRTVGNAAVVAMLRSPSAPVQRETEDIEVTTGRAKNTLDTIAQNVGTTTATTIGSQFTDPTVSTPASYAGGMAAPFSSAIAAGAGLVTGIAAIRRAQHDKDAATPGDSTHRDASRDLDSARAEVGQSASGLVGNMLNGAGGALNFAGQAPAVYNAVLSAGAAVTLPASMLQTARYARKAAKAQDRVEALRKLMTAETENPKKALEAADQEVADCRELVDALKELHTAKSAVYQARLQEIGRSPADRPMGTDLDTLKQALLEVHELERKLHEADHGLQEALAGHKERQDAADAMHRALTEAAQEVTRHRPDAPEPLSLRMIQAYATRKNERGRIKKIIAATGGALGTSGSVAALVASIAVAAGASAGASTLLATPVGWALAGAGAAVGLSLATYQAWKYFAKRWEQLAEHDASGKPTRSPLARLGKTLAFWKKAGPGKRKEYAGALYRMAEGEQDADPVRTQEARKTIAALGLDWDALTMNAQPESAKKLIAAKLAS